VNQQPIQENTIKHLFKGYRKMTKKLQNELWTLGISVEHKKRHYVLKLHGTNQMFICPCTASDSKSGINLANYLIRTMRYSNP
jgi:hypothetical protein